MNFLKPLTQLGKIPKNKETEFRNGVGGNMDTVSFMKKTARKYATNPEIRRLAEEIVNSKNIQSHNHLSEALAIGEFVQKNCRYLKDPHTVEQLQSPLLMLKRMKEGKCRGDCDDMALMISTLLLSIGIRPYLCIVKYSRKSKGFNHIYVCVYEQDHNQPKTRMALDAIVKDRTMGYEVNYAEKKEIAV